MRGDVPDTVKIRGVVYSDAITPLVVCMYNPHICFHVFIHI